MRTRLTRIGIVSAAVAAVLAVASCTHPSSSGDGGGNKTLTVAEPEAPISLNPFGAQSAEESTRTIAVQVFDYLVTRDGADYKPDLATKWENPSPTEWKFTLRSDVKFSDGTSLTSADVKASLDALRSGGGPLASLWKPVTATTADDPHVFGITTSTPMGALLLDASILPIAKGSQIKDKDFGNKPIGSGAFTVDSFTSGRQAVLKASPTYWGTKPKYDKLVFKYYPDTSGRMTALQNGEVDVTWSIPPDQVATVQGVDSLNVKTEPSYSYYFDWFNASKPPFNDARVRQAMWYALDVNSIVKNIYGASASVAKAPIPQAVTGAASFPPYPYDPAKAKSLLAAAGYPNGLTTTMMWSSGCNCPNVQDLATAMISQWAKVGVVVKPQPLENATWLDKLLKLQWDMDLQVAADTTGDPDYNVGRLYLSSANRTGFKDPTLDQTIKSAQSSLDSNQRLDDFKKAQTIIWNQAVGIFPMDLNTTWAWNKRVSGFTPTPSQIPDFRSVTLGQ